MLRKRLEGKFVLSHYYFYCIYRQLCVTALKFFTCALISVHFLLNEVDLHKEVRHHVFLIVRTCFKPN